MGEIVPRVRSPLGSVAANGRELHGVGVALRELLGLEFVHVATRNAAPEQLIRLGLPAQAQPQGGQRPQVFWLNPDEWLCVDVAADTFAAADDQSWLAIDVTHGRAALALVGPNAAQVLSKGCGLDFHPSRFAVGAYAQTRLAQAAVLVHRRGGGFDIHCAADIAAYLWQWLEAAMEEFRSRRRESAP